MRSLRVQVVAVITLVLALGLGSLLLVAGSQMTEMTVQAFVRKQEVATLAVSSGLSETLRQWLRGGIDPQQFQQYISYSANKLDISLTIVSPTGKVITTTHDSPPSTSDALEVTQALNGSRVINQIRDGTLYVASPIVYENQQIIGVVWADVPLTSVVTELQIRWLVLIGATAAALLLAGGVAWWLASRIVQPLAEIQVVAEQMANGKLESRASISENSQEFASLGRAFNNMAQQVEAMLLRQREFVANASHELRSPLASIKLRAEALAQGTVDGDRARQYAAEINEETIRLGQLVANLLQLSRAESGTFTPPCEAISVADELSAIVRAQRPRVAEKHQQLNVAIQESMPELYIYPDDLRLMVENLLDNAVKYTPQNGKVALAAQWADDLLTVEVSDTGPGIPPDDLPHVTERFFRVDRAHNRSVPGTGLGLALVVATAKQYDGALTIHSSGYPGGGTQACLELKLKAVSPTAIPTL